MRRNIDPSRGRSQARRRTSRPPSIKDPRKVAQQERSRTTLEAVFDAMSVAIADKGLDGFSVVEVARIANVGKASIYDYYPTRIALIAAWEERTIGKEMAKLGARVADILKAPPKFEFSAIELVTFVVDSFAQHAARYHYRERFDVRAKSAVPESQAEQAVAMFKTMLTFAPSRARFRAMELEVAARTITHAVLGLSYALAVTTLTDAERRAHARQLARMICSYLLVDCEDALFDGVTEPPAPPSVGPVVELGEQPRNE